MVQDLGCSFEVLGDLGLKGAGACLNAKDLGFEVWLWCPGKAILRDGTHSGQLSPATIHFGH